MGPGHYDGGTCGRCWTLLVDAGLEIKSPEPYLKFIPVQVIFFLRIDTVFALSSTIAAPSPSRTYNCRQSLTKLNSEDRDGGDGSAVE